MQNKLAKLRMLTWRTGAVVGRLKYLLVVLVIVALGLIAWQYHKTSVANDWKKATDYYQRADYNDAAKILNKMSMPNDPAKLSIYAQTMLATRQLDKAASAYTHLYNIKKDPFSELVLGNIFNQQGKYSAAEKIYKQLISSDPSYTQAYVNLATMYKLEGNNTKAMATAEEAVTNNPNNTVLNELLVSLTMTDKNSSQYKNAVAKLKQLNPNDPLLAAIQQQ